MGAKQSSRTGRARTASHTAQQQQPSARGKSNASRKGQFKHGLPDDYSLAHAQKLKKTLDEEERRLGIEHLQTLETLRSLATTYENLGKHKEALACSKRLVDVRARIPGDGEPSKGRCMEALGASYFYLGRYADALGLYEKILKMYQRLYQKDLKAFECLIVCQVRVRRK